MARRQFLLRLHLQSNPQVLCAVRGAITPVASAIGFGEKDCRAITLAVDEALANIIRHAYSNKPGRPIEVSIHKLPTSVAGKPGLEILLIDKGIAPKPQAMKGLPPGELRAGGLGLHFMRQSMDAVVHKRLGVTNRLRMVKYIP